MGKSTLVLQMLASTGGQGSHLLLIAAEESERAGQAPRAGRLGAAVEGCYVLATTDLDAVINAAGQLEPSILVVDSIQAVSDAACASQAGSPSQVRECAAGSSRFAKSLGGGDRARRPRHQGRGTGRPTDARAPCRHGAVLRRRPAARLRLLSASKHRYGPAGEIGLFEMTEGGLESLVDPSALLLGDRTPGSARKHRRAGARGAQAAHHRGAGPRRTLRAPEPRGESPKASSRGRLALLLAVLERRCQWRWRARTCSSQRSAVCG